MDPADLEAVNHKHAQHHTHEHDGEHAPTDADAAPSALSDIGNAGVGRLLQAGGVQRSGVTSAQQLDETVARSIEERRGRGAPLDEPVREEMESALGADLSDVNVHTDADAHALNDAVSARAFTSGSDVFFKQGTYDPGSTQGKHLLAHELTHVVQQREGTSGLGAGEVSDPSDAAEVEAEAVGAQVAAGQAPAADGGAAAPAGVARDAMEEEEELQMSAEPGVQRQEMPEEEELQMSAEPGVQREEMPEEEELQLSAEPGVQREEELPG